MFHRQNTVDEECLITEFGCKDGDRTMCQNVLDADLFHSPRAQEPDSYESVNLINRTFPRIKWRWFWSEGMPVSRNWSKTPTDKVTFFSWGGSGFSQKHGICSREKKKWNEENLERCHSVIKKHKNSLMPWLPLLQSANAPLVHRKPRADDTSWSQ